MVKCDFVTCKDKQQFPMKKIRKIYQIFPQVLPFSLRWSFCGSFVKDYLQILKIIQYLWRLNLPGP